MITKAQHLIIRAQVDDLSAATDRLLDCIREDDAERAIEDLEDVDTTARQIVRTAALVLQAEARDADVAIDLGSVGTATRHVLNLEDVRRLVRNNAQAASAVLAAVRGGLEEFVQANDPDCWITRGATDLGAALDEVPAIRPRPASRQTSRADAQGSNS